MAKKLLFCALLFLSHGFLSFGQLKVTFKINNIPPAKMSSAGIFLAGDFNNWNPADKAFEMQKDSAGSYLLFKVLPKGMYNFKLTRGSWQMVECTALGKSIDNRSVTVAHDTTIMMDVAGWQDDFKPEEKKHTASANVRIISEKFDIPQLGRQRRIWIYLPPDYKLSNKKYAVIYMQDGQNLFDEYTSGYGEWGVDELMDKLPAKDQCIIVGIDHGGEHRLTEYDPYDSKFGKAEGSQYVEFLVKTLKPYIDQHYHTKTDARHTTIAGSSMGGLISMYAVLKYPDVFGNGGIFSPSFWIAPEMYKYAQQANLNPKPRFYFVCGDSESGSMAPDMQKMADLLRSKGITEKSSPVAIIKDAHHNEKQWKGDFLGFYQWLIRKSESQ